MKNNYLGYSLFNDVGNQKLQAFNRAVVLKNIKKLLGINAVSGYLNLLSVSDRSKIAVMFVFAKDSSWEEVGKNIRMEMV